jgi:hypothetical protein
MEHNRLAPDLTDHQPLLQEHILTMALKLLMGNHSIVHLVPSLMDNMDHNMLDSLLANSTQQILSLIVQLLNLVIKASLMELNLVHNHLKDMAILNNSSNRTVIRSKVHHLALSLNNRDPHLLDLKQPKVQQVVPYLLHPLLLNILHPNSHLLMVLHRQHL